MSTKRKGLLQKVLMLVLVLCLVCGNGLMALADEAVASSMRLTKTEGTVSVTNKNGRDMGTMADMKLFNGYHLSTAQKSYAWMNLDDHKLVKMDAVSEAEIQKKGKDLEILLNSGNLLFNVSENLKADETLNIRTSTMVTGIRGTCGWVKVLDSSRTQVYILEGQVECYVMDPVTGQYKSVTLRSGETAEFVVYDQTRIGDKCDILINRFNEKNIPGFVAVELMNDQELRDRVTGAMNIDINWILGNVPAILVQDQNHVEQMYAPINEAVKQQENNVAKDPLFNKSNDDDDDDDNDGGGSGGGGSDVTPPDGDPTQPEPENLTTKTLTVEEAETDDQLNYYLSMETMETVTIITDAPDILNISDITTISSKQQLILSDGVGLQVEEGAELHINGKLSTTNGDITNYGTIMNTNLYSFNVGSSLYNEVGGIIENTGKISIGTILNNRGEITSSGLLIGSVSVMEGGRLDIISNDTNDTKLEDVEKGPLTVVADTGGYVALYSNMTELVDIGLNGGTVEYAGANEERLDLENGHVIVSNGSTIGELYVQGMESTVTVNTGGTVEELFTTSSIVTVDGGTVTELTEVRGEVSGDGTTTATAPSTVTVNNGNVTTITMERGDLTVGGGTIENAAVNNWIQVSGGNIDTLTLVNARYLSDAVNVVNASGTVKLDNGKIVEANFDNAETEIEGEVSVLTQNSGNLSLLSGTVERISLLGDTIGTIAGGNVTDGLVIGEGASVQITGGTIHSGDSEAAIVFNSGELRIDTEAQIMSEDAAKLIAFGNPNLQAILAEDIENPDTYQYVGLSMYPICSKADGSSEVSLKRYEYDLLTVIESPQDGDYLMLLDDVSWVGSEIPDKLYVTVFGGVDSPTQFTLDLHGHEIYMDEGCSFSVQSLGDIGAEGEEKNTLIICDTGERKGVLRIEGSFKNYADLILDGVEAEALSTIYNGYGGSLEFRGGKYSYTGRKFLDNVQGTVRICNAADLDINILREEETDTYYGISSMGGNIYIGEPLEDSDNTNSNPVVIDMTMDDPLPDALIFIAAGSGEVTLGGENYKGVIKLENVELNVENGSAVAFDGEAIQLTVGEGAVISADSSYGTVECYGSIYEDCIIFSGGEIINTCGVNGHGAITMGYRIDDPDSTKIDFIPEDPDKMNTILKSIDDSIVSYYYYYASQGKTFFEKYVWADDYTTGTENGFHYVTGTRSQSFMMKKAPELSNSASNAMVGNDSIATDSNASGLPTGTSKSAIPMAVAMLAGLMALAPKLFEDNANKNREER